MLKCRYQNSVLAPYKAGHLDCRMGFLLLAVGPNTAVPDIDPPTMIPFPILTLTDDRFSILGCPDGRFPMPLSRRQFPTQAIGRMVVDGAHRPPRPAPLTIPRLSGGRAPLGAASRHPARASLLASCIVRGTGGRAVWSLSRRVSEISAL